MRVTDSRISGNLGEPGGGITVGFGATLDAEECTIVGNLPCGIVFSGEELNVRRSTISGNRSPVMQGGGILVLAGSGSVSETVLWGNCASGGSDLYSYASDLLLTCCVIDTNGIGGVEPIVDRIIGADPEFCDPSSCYDSPFSEGNYNVRESSPCLPGNNVCGTLIGAETAECGTTAVSTISWGAMKSLFREEK